MVWKGAVLLNMFVLFFRAQAVATAQDALLAMDASALSVEQLDALSRAVPDDSERRDIRLYLKVRLRIVVAASHAIWCVSREPTARGRHQCTLCS